ncbi:hypothetical protein RJ639_018832 [Escallonia herrerae]|uniref:Uncharacterized protein n=2 Tax=Escallonia herrerae TaxID=1293975 RepID=A0AA88VA17_9ASTE|nr:hypothetical protein RJ639_018832 [Escallonia herrerae]
MGTEIQSKAYFPGYYSTRDLHNSADNGMWALYHEDKTLRNGQHHASFLTRAAIYGYSGNDKEQVRETILRHESIFRHQLQELHRLYRRQRDLMNELRSSGLGKHSVPAETSKASVFLSQNPSEDSKRTWHVSNSLLVNSTFGRPLASGTDSIQSPLNFIEGKSPCCPFISIDRVCLKDEKSLKSQRSIFDLELPADGYMNNEGKQREKGGASWVQSYSSTNHKVQYAIDANQGCGFKVDADGDAMSPNLCRRRTHGLADLNEPILTEETSLSASFTCIEEDIRMRDVFSNPKSSFQLLSKEVSQSSPVGKDGRTCVTDTYSWSERNGKEHLTCSFNFGQSKCNDHVSTGAKYPDHSPAVLKLLQDEPGKEHEPLSFSLSAQSKTDSGRKRIIFGVDISGENHNLSVDASLMPSLNPLKPQHGAINSETYSASPLRKASRTLVQNVVTVQKNYCSGTVDPFPENPNKLMQFSEFNGDSRLLPTSRAGVAYQNSVCLGSQLDGKQLQDCCSSIGFEIAGGINARNSATKQFMQLGPIENLKGSDCGYVAKDEAVIRQNDLSAETKKKHENSGRGLPWVITKRHCNGEEIQRKENIYQMNMDTLQNHSQHFFSKAEVTRHPSPTLIQDLTSPTCGRESEYTKVEIRDCGSGREMLGVPIVGVHHISKVLVSPSSISKSGVHGSNADDDDNTRKDLTCDANYGNLLQAKDLVVGDGLNNSFSGIRPQIDLNLSLNEEENPSAPSLPRAILKIATKEIDLEAPALLDSQTDLSHEADSQTDKTLRPSKLLLDDLREPYEELVRVAAEAIISISSSGLRTLDASCQSLEPSASDSLLWFAEVISSHSGCDLESKVSKVLINLDDDHDEESIPEGMDYFEFMTLKLKDTKEEDYCCKQVTFENHEDEGTRPTSLPKRPRKGQARRRKDFQRDILPGLVSLSRQEVTKDLQTIEELFQASGCTWQSSLSQRKGAKNGRGRRRSGVQTPSLTATAVCPPPMQQPSFRQQGLQETSLTGWGKRTRRLPRQRCLTGNHALSLKC